MTAVSAVTGVTTGVSVVVVVLDGGGPGVCVDVTGMVACRHAPIVAWGGVPPVI